MDIRCLPLPPASLFRTLPVLDQMEFISFISYAKFFEGGLMEVCHFFIHPSVWHGLRIGLVRFREVGTDEAPLYMQEAWFVVVKPVTMAHFTRT